MQSERLYHWPWKVLPGRYVYRTVDGMLCGGFTAGNDGTVIFEDDNGMQFGSSDFEDGEYFEPDSPE